MAPRPCSKPPDSSSNGCKGRTGKITLIHLDTGQHVQRTRDCILVGGGVGDLHRLGRDGQCLSQIGPRRLGERAVGEGFTPEQRFFLGYAQIWRSVQRDEDLKLRLNTDPHSPGRYRVNGPLSDLVEFQKAFNLPENCPMVRSADKKVNIW